jgi:hypothetical protein
MNDMNAEGGNLSRSNVNDTVHEKFMDLMIPGYQAEFSPEEADLAGAFTEDALSERDALESGFDAE